MTFKHKLSARLALMRAAALLAMVATGGCELPVRPREAQDPNAATRVVVSPLTAVLPTNQTADLLAVALTATGDTSDTDVRWSTSANGGSISDTSTVNRVHRGRYHPPSAPGQYRAIAQTQSGSVADTAVLTVIPVPVTTVTVTPTTATLAVGVTFQFTAVTADSAGNPLTGRSTTWSSNNGAVATVNGNGLVTAAGQGSATITALCEGHTGTATVTVTFVAVAAVAVAPATVNLQVGNTRQLTATTTDSAGNVLTGRTISWVTNNAGVASVSSSGLVRALAAGLATITATSEGKSGSASITVTNVPVASVAVTPASPSIQVGATVQLTATPRDAGGNALTGRVITWATNNSAVATVSGSGLVSGATAGSATITATSEGVNGTAAVSVTTPPPPPPPPPSGLRTFPGAEGYGTTTAAGRGGQVIRVTNLNDAGTGSLRAALMASGTRTIIFDVSGTIDVLSTLYVTNGNLTIAGQTAPSPGITLRITGPVGVTNNGLDIAANDVLIQHIRVRGAPSAAGGSRRDVMLVEGDRVVLDHVTASWGGSGSGKTTLLYGTDVTVINCIISESFPYAMLVQGGTKVSVIRTLIAHNTDRNPEVASNTQVTLVNNLVYNPSWPTAGAFSVWRGPPVGQPADGPTYASLIGNVAKAGPTSGVLAPIFKATAVAGSQAYFSDNAFPDGVLNEGVYSFVGSPPRALPSPLTILPSSQVEANVLANAGARPLDRDPVDTRIINSVINRTGSTNISNELDVGGFPVLAQNTRVLTIPANQATIRPSGYSVLEEDILIPLAKAVGSP